MLVSWAGAIGAGVFDRLDWRPQNHTAIPAASRTAAPPIAIPAIAPTPRVEWEADAAAAAGVLVVVAVDEVEDADAVATPLGIDPSLGQSSPGTKAKVLCPARSFWCCRLVLAFGLMTPTISYPMQLFGAPQ